MTGLLDTFRFKPLPAQAQALRSDVKRFLADALPAANADQRARSWLAFDAEFSQKLARRGWVGTSLPARYGGAALDPYERFVLAEELLAAGAPVGAHWIADRQSGPLILRYGSDAQKERLLPAICRGEAFFCIGMSEPGAGSDLASVSTRAVRTAAGWRLSGHKIWTTHGHQADFCIALVRTSGTAAQRHAGLSQFVIDMRLPGITAKPITDLSGDRHFCEIFFDDVELGEDALLGQEGQGWAQVTAELAFERSGPERLYSSIVLLDCWIAWLRDTRSIEGHLAALGWCVAQLATLRQLSIAVTARLAEGQSPVVEAALVKDIGTGFEQAIPDLVEAAIGSDPERPPSAELMRAAAYTSAVAPTFSLRGGTREVLRRVIARGLGLR